MNDETGLGGVPPSWAPLPPRLPAGLLTWIWPLLRMSEAHLIASAGLDVAMLLRFIRFGEAGREGGRLCLCLHLPGSPSGAIEEHLT